MDFGWVVELRSESLTAFFKIAPLLVTDYFYIGAVALGFQRYPRLAKSLGFLIPFSVLLNYSLKNIFQIPRPSADLHLVPVLDPFGFPSGDAQVAAVFWMTIFFYFKNTSLRFLCFIPLVIIMLSRVYFGVHSPFDVLGGLGFSLCTLYGWTLHLKHEQNILTAPSQFWTTVIGTFGFYAIVSHNLPWYPRVSVAMGAMIGFHCVLQKISSFQRPWILGLTGFFGAVLMGKVKTFITDPFLLHPLIILKYTFLIVGVFFFVAYAFSKIRPKT